MADDTPPPFTSAPPLNAAGDKKTPPPPLDSARPAAPSFSTEKMGTPSFSTGEMPTRKEPKSTGISNKAVPSDAPAGNADLIMSIPVEVQVVLGATHMPVATLMNLGRGAIIALDKQIGDPVDIVVNGRVIARGEVIVMEDDTSRFGVSLTEIIGK